MQPLPGHSMTSCQGFLASWLSFACMHCPWTGLEISAQSFGHRKAWAASLPEPLQSKTTPCLCTGSAHPCAPQGALEQLNCLHKSSASHPIIFGAVSAAHTRVNVTWQHHCDRATMGQETHHRLGSCTRCDCAHAQSCLLSRGISMTQLNHLVRQHYLLQRKHGAGRGELAARHFARHYVPLVALKLESPGSSYSLGRLPRLGRGGGRRAPRRACSIHQPVLSLGCQSAEHLLKPWPCGSAPWQGGL